MPLIHSLFREAKNSHLLGNLSPDHSLKLSLYLYRYASFSFSSSRKPFLNSSDKIIIIWQIFDHCMTRVYEFHAANKNLLLIIKAMYFSNPFGIPLTPISNLHISCTIKWLSKPFKLWNITGIVLVILRLVLQL